MGSIYTPPPPITTAAVLAATSGAAAGAVGTYALLYIVNGSPQAVGSTWTASYLYYGSAGGDVGQTPSGTWKLLGQTVPAESGSRCTVFLRIA